MIIGGFQPLTLIDYPGLIATIVFTKGCNFRCPYCHNPELVEPENWESEEILQFYDFLRKRSHILDGVVVTGGEPTLHKDLPAFISKIKELGFKVKLDTNGSNPAMVESLIMNNLIDYVAMDIKHTWEKYQLVANVDNEKSYLLENCRRTMELLRDHSFPREFRTTVYTGVHTEHDLEQILNELKPNETYYLQEMRYEKTLRKGLERGTPIDLARFSQRMTEIYPDRIIHVR